MANMNGSGNHDDEGEKDPKVVNFLTRAEREEIARQSERMRDPAAFAKRARDAQKSEPIFNVPPATKYLSGLLILIHVVMEFLPLPIKEQVLQFGAFLPQLYFTDMPLGDLDRIAAVVGPFGHMLLHGGWLHLAMNVFTLMAFGAGLEKEIGGKKFLLLFVVTGLAGAFTHLAYIAWFHPNDLSPLVGASGGISGLFGGVLMMAHGRGLMGEGYSKLLPFIGIWILISLFFGIFGMPGTGAAIAWTTHIGGFIAGLLLYRPIAKMNMR